MLTLRYPRKSLIALGLLFVLLASCSDSDADQISTARARVPEASGPTDLAGVFVGVDKVAIADVEIGNKALASGAARPPLDAMNKAKSLRAIDCTEIVARYGRQVIAGTNDLVSVCFLALASEPADGKSFEIVQMLLPPDVDLDEHDQLSAIRAGAIAVIYNGSGAAAVQTATNDNAEPGVDDFANGKAVLTIGDDAATGAIFDVGDRTIAEWAYRDTQLFVQVTSREDPTEMLGWLDKNVLALP